MNDFTNRYNTKLTPEQETAFLNWASANNRLRDVYDYDMRGAWSKGITEDKNAHFPDTYKKPNHPSFSNESIYHGVDGYEGGTWRDVGGVDEFTPGKTNLEFMSRDQLKEYLARNNSLLGGETVPNPDMITQYLASRDATPSADNANRVRQHFAANPDLLDRRALGLPGGLDDNSSVLDAMLDKHVAESMPASPGVAMVGQPETIPPPSRTAPAAKGKGEIGGTDTAKAGAPSRQGNYGPGASPSRQGEYGTPSTSTTNATSVTGDLTGSSYASGSQVGPTQRSGLSDWLIGLLTGGAGLYGLSKMAGGGGQAAAPTGPLPGSTPPAAAPVDTTDQATMKARMQAEIDAENDAMTRKMMEDESRARAQKRTKELTDAAKRATGRR